MPAGVSHKKEWYANALQRQEWIDKSYEVKARDGFKCLICEGTKNLSVHHTYYSGNPWDVDSRSLGTLCASCHKWVHDWQEYLGLENSGVVSLLKIIGEINRAHNLELHKVALSKKSKKLKREIKSKNDDIDNLEYEVRYFRKALEIIADWDAGPYGDSGSPPQWYAYDVLKKEAKV